MNINRGHDQGCSCGSSLIFLIAQPLPASVLTTAPTWRPCETGFWPWPPPPQGTLPRSPLFLFSHRVMPQTAFKAEIPLNSRPVETTRHCQSQQQTTQPAVRFPLPEFYFLRKIGFACLPEMNSMNNKGRQDDSIHLVFFTSPRIVPLFGIEV